MIRILVADDERPVVEGISHLVRRDLASEFEVVGTASSGREAIEKAGALSPDLILMDVRMPGISGLDAIREIKRRGSTSAFILITAYERFDIAREAVELGVMDYLLKPVSKDSLALSLRSAAGFIGRKGETERREIEHREREEGMRGFVEAAFLQGIMLGERSNREISKYCSTLGISEPLAALGAAAFLPPQGALDSGFEARKAYDTLRATVRYKTRALVGPLVSGLCALLLPVREGEEGSAREELRGAIEEAHSWSSRAAGCGSASGGSVRSEKRRVPGPKLSPICRGAARRRPWARDHGRRLWDFAEDEELLEALLAPSPERASLALERIAAPLRGLAVLPAAYSYRFVSLVGSGIRALRRRGTHGRGGGGDGHGPRGSQKRWGRQPARAGLPLSDIRPRRGRGGESSPFDGAQGGGRRDQGAFRQAHHLGICGRRAGYLPGQALAAVHRGARQGLFRLSHRLSYREGQGDALPSRRGHQAGERGLRLS